MRVTTDDADYLGLGPDEGFGSERYHFLDKPHQWARSLREQNRIMREALKMIAERSRDPFAGAIARKALATLEGK